MNQDQSRIDPHGRYYILECDGTGPAACDRWIMKERIGVAFMNTAGLKRVAFRGAQQTEWEFNNEPRPEPY